jgi:RNA polymerase sigma factor (sigma-70 family)
VPASIYKKHTDTELVNMCLNGDALAWEALIMRYRRFIYSIPVKFGFQAVDAADIFQTVCLKLLEHLHEVKDESKINAWLSTTTTRQCLSTLANRHRETPTPDEEFEEPLDPSMNLEEIQVLSEAQQDIRDCIQDLPPRCRSLIDMLYFDPRSLSYQEISQSLEIPVASIGPNRARCLERLKKILQQRGIK